FELGPSSASLFPPFALKSEVPLIMTLYDLIPLMRPKQYLGRDLGTMYRMRLETLKQADLILCISEHTRRDALSMLEIDPGKLVPIGAGVGEFFRPAASEDDPAEEVAANIPAIRKPFVLSVLGAEPRKNTEGLIEAFALLPRDLRRQMQLVIVCALNDEYVESWTGACRENGLSGDDVVLTGLIPDRVLLALYRSARLFVFPSFYEGFGLPAAEAAACGCPTITSNTSSMPEILEMPESTFDPSDAESIAEKMCSALTDEEFRLRLREAAFRASGRWTWDSVAEKTIAALERLPAPVRRYPRRAARLPRIAFAGPFPPLRSGIADYNLRIARELSGICDLDVLVPVDQLDRSLGEELPGVSIYPLEALGRFVNPYAYDAIVYVLGNNEHHHSTYEKVVAYPGIVWLHDAQLAGLYISYGKDRWQGASGKIFAGYKLHEMYGLRTPQGLIETADESIAQYVSHGIGMSQEVVAASQGVVVTSPLARDMVRLDAGPLGRVPPIEVIPLAVPAFPQRLHPYEGPPTVGSFGIGGWHKAPDVLLEAFALVKKAVDCRLVFAGPLYDDLGASLRRRAEELGIESFVSFRGNLSRSDYVGALHEVTCAVQIRRGSHGESSAAIADCLGTGVPVITNVLSCWGFPEGTVNLVPPDPPADLLAERIRQMLVDVELRSSFARAGTEYARAHTYSGAASRLVSFCTTAGGPGSSLKNLAGAGS
ncbi:MAG: glycosyltransferase, partial [Actinomycetota bacterium]